MRAAGGHGANGGLSKPADDDATTAPRATGLALLRETGRFVPFHGLYDSIEAAC